MKHIIGINEFLNEGFSNNFIQKSIKFIERLKDLFDGIEIPEEDLDKLLNSPSIYSSVCNTGFFKQIKNVYNNNKDRIKQEYDLVFGTNEEFICSLLISVAVMFAFYYAAKKGYLDKLIGKIDEKI